MDVHATEAKTSVEMMTLIGLLVQGVASINLNTLPAPTQDERPKDAVLLGYADDHMKALWGFRHQVAQQVDELNSEMQHILHLLHTVDSLADGGPSWVEKTNRLEEIRTILQTQMPLAHMADQLFIYELKRRIPGIRGHHPSSIDMYSDWSVCSSWSSCAGKKDGVDILGEAVQIIYVHGDSAGLLERLFGGNLRQMFRFRRQ